MTDPSDQEEWQCEACGEWVDEPGHTEKRKGYRETVILAFCEDCTRRNP